MDFQAVLMSPIPDSRHLRQRPNSTPSLIRGVLDADQSGHAVVLIVRPDLSFEIVQIEQSTLSAKATSGNAAQGCRRSGFVIHNMTRFVDQDLVALLTMSPNRHLVRLSSRAVVDRRFLV